MSELTVRFKVNFRKACKRKKESAANQEASKDAKSPKTATTKPGATRIARMLALAYFVERQVETGVIKDYAEAARRLGISRARMSQIVNLINLSVSFQETILLGAKVSERGLRGQICQCPS